METILVTGGKGFLGRNLVSRLNMMGRTIKVFAHAEKNGRQSEVSNNYDEIVWGDIRDPGAVEQAVKGADVVIHLVSNFRKGGSDKEAAYGVNVEGTINVLNASFKHHVKQLIHCSTIGVHGDVRSIPANEETPFNPGDLYQQTKLIAEQKVWEFYKNTGLPITVVRPISMYGPGDRRMLKLFRTIKKGWFVMVGSGRVLFQPAYIDDIVSGFLLCLGNKRVIGEALIIGGDEYLPLQKLVELIATELKVAPPRLKVPLTPVLLLASLCERVFAPLGVEPPLHRRRVSFFENNRAFSIEKARRMLGYAPKVPLKDGLRRTIQWYESQGYL